MPYSSEHAARLQDPGRYEKIRRQNDKFGAGVDVLFGILSDGKTEVQAIRFDAGRFTAEQARAWLREHDYTPIEFAAATGPDAYAGTGQEAKRIKISDLTAQDLERATPASLAAVHARAHEMLGDKHAPTEQIEHLHALAVAELERRGTPDGTPLALASTRGLYMSYPHGELLYQGRKQAIGRGSGRTLAGQWIAVSNGQAYGVITVGEPEAVNADVFDARFSEHRVTTKERAKWWPDRDRLWIHPITDFQPYATPRPCIVPQGTNLVMNRVAFQDGQKAEPARDRCMLCAKPPEVDLLWADGRGRAWFCAECFPDWAKQEGEWLELVKAWAVAGGQVPERWQDHKRGEALGDDPEQIAAKLTTIAAMEKERHTGAMVAFYVPSDVAAKLALGGDIEGARAIPANELHLTLAYLGKISELGDGQREKARRALQRVAGQMPPISGKIGGTGRFNKVEADGGRAHYASFDAPLLPAFRQELIDTLKADGATFSTEHGFTPHITLMYSDGTHDLDVAEYPITFGDLVLAWGDEREVFPLRGTDAALKAADSTANSITVIRSVGSKARARHASAEKAGADEIGHRSLGSVVIEAGGMTFAGTASVTVYKTRSTGHEWYRYDVDFDPPIAVEGKGENSWDIGQDHTYSISVPLDSDDEAGHEIARARVARSIPVDRVLHEKGNDLSGNLAHTSGAPLMAHLDAGELEALLILLQGMESEEATQARASLAQQLAQKGSDLSGNWGHTSEQRRGVGRGGSDPGGGLMAIGAGRDFSAAERRQASELTRRARTKPRVTGAYVRGQLARLTAVHDKRVIELWERSRELNKEFNHNLTGRNDAEIKRDAETDRTSLTYIVEDQKVRIYTQRLDALSDEIAKNNGEIDQAHERRYQEMRELFYVDDPLQTSLLTGRLRKVDGVKQGFEDFRRMVPDRMVPEAPPIPVKRGTHYKGQRSYYTEDGTIHMTLQAGTRSTIHELGHWLEGHNPTIRQKAQAFLKSRSGGENPRQLSSITGDKSYKDHERAVKDSFMNPYMGKSYADGGTEIISMGMEYMYALPVGFAEQDPEMFDFVFNTIRGIE